MYHLLLPDTFPSVSSPCTSTDTDNTNINTNIQTILLIHKYTLQVKCEHADGLPKMDSVTKGTDPYLVVSGPA